MGTDFIAMLGHNLDERQLNTIPELLNSTWHENLDFLPVLDGYPAPGSAPKKWCWYSSNHNAVLQEFQSRGTILLEGPDCFHGHVGKRCLELKHLARWWAFLSDETIRLRLRAACRHIAAALGTKRIVYIPDSSFKTGLATDLLYEDKTIDDIIDWLYVNCGPPAPDIDSTVKEDQHLWSANGYYIEVL